MDEVSTFIKNMEANNIPAKQPLPVVLLGDLTTLNMLIGGDLRDGLDLGCTLDLGDMDLNPGAALMSPKWCTSLLNTSAACTVQEWMMRVLAFKQDAMVAVVAARVVMTVTVHAS